ncbi:HAMP domain-containing protein [Deinococcus psychrotolerans]|uniref:histidine kinase n=1 Tax=Deinococcus psychrotolerans TaxID=2489213 RepID=A0A3G8YAZ7_9DEIO|nr:sensor histidine kinase [Deinococcus psychrotolerans]AZI42100.1 HAMP domain-containing protein [Deinococcus psychrotolerans]
MRLRPVLLSTQSLTQFLLLPLLGPLLLLLAVTGAVIWGIDRNALQIQQLNAAQVRLNLINLLARDIIDMETGIRGYVIVGDTQYLEPYRRGSASVKIRLKQLQTLSVSDQQRLNLSRVGTLVERWTTRVAEPEILVRPNSAAQAAALIGKADGKELIDTVRDVLAVLEHNEMLRREAAASSSLMTLRLTRSVTIIGLLSALLLVFFAAQRSARTLTRGLQTLNTGAERIAQGHYGEMLLDVPVREVQALRSQFYRMADAVEQREEGLKAAQSVLERTNRDLERSNRELEQFAYVASHDLQEPLRTIGSYTELLAKRYSGQLDQRADQYIAFTLSATHRLKGLIQDLLLYSRVRQHAKAAELFGVQPLVASIVKDFQHLIERTDASIEVGTLPQAWGNPELLRHVFQNLIGNALKFHDPARPPRVHVSAEALPEAWKFSVADNGIGIDPAYFERIFGVFQRLHGIGVFEGSGIGLAVVKNVVERHGGQLSIESSVGQGSTFSFTLPYQQNAPAAVSPLLTESKPLVPTLGPSPTPFSPKDIHENH